MKLIKSFCLENKIDFVLSNKVFSIKYLTQYELTQIIYICLISNLSFQLSKNLVIWKKV